MSDDAVAPALAVTVEALLDGSCRKKCRTDAGDQAQEGTRGGKKGTGTSGRVSHADRWERNYRKLATFREEAGHFHVPESVEFSSLCHWVSNQRHNYKSGKLTKDRATRLQRIGFTWDGRTSVTMPVAKTSMLNPSSSGTLKNSILVPITEVGGAEGRLLQATAEIGRLSKRVAALEAELATRPSLPSPGEQLWDARYDEILSFRLEHGHCRVPLSNPLYRWMRSQRKAYSRVKRGQTSLERSEPLSAEQISRLDRLGFVWNAIGEHGRAILGEKGGDGGGDGGDAADSSTDIEKYSQIWECRFLQLERYRAERGHCKISHGEDKALRLWVSRQRAKYHDIRPDGTRALRPDHTERLVALGVDWMIPATGRLANLASAAWACACGHANAARKVRCGRCQRWRDGRRPRRDDAVTDGADPRVAPPWACDRCGHANRAAQSRCAACSRWRDGQRRPYGPQAQWAAPPPRAPEEPLPATAPGRWACGGCHHLNDANKRRCGSCQRWKFGKRENMLKKNRLVVVPTAALPTPAGQHWLCGCGRANLPGKARCSACQRWKGGRRDNLRGRAPARAPFAATAGLAPEAPNRPHAPWTCAAKPTSEEA